MKKKLAQAVSVLAAAAMAAAMVGCGSSDSGTEETAEEEAAEEAEEEAEEEEAEAEEEAAEETEEEAEEEAEVSGDLSDPASYGDDVAEIMERGVLRVGVKNAVEGFGYQDTLTGEYSGMEIELAEGIAETLGVEVEFTAVTAATRTELLDSGDLDCVIATFTITDERKLSWDFTTPYYTDHVSVLVQTDSGITSLADLEGKVVGVSSGSTSAKSLVEAMIDAGVISGDNYDADTFDPATWEEGVSFRQYDDYPTISTGLAAGEVDAFCVDKSILAIYNTEDRTYIDEEFAPQEYGIATTMDSGMSALCEDEITLWLSDGTIDALYEEFGLD